MSKTILRRHPIFVHVPKQRSIGYSPSRIIANAENAFKLWPFYVYLYEKQMLR